MKWYYINKITSDKSHTLPSRTSRHADQNLAKSVSSEPLKKKKKIKNENTTICIVHSYPA